MPPCTRMLGCDSKRLTKIERDFLQLWRKLAEITVLLKRMGLSHRCGLAFGDPGAPPECRGTRNLSFQVPRIAFPWFVGRIVDCYPTIRTFCACGPFCPWVISNSTTWPSSQFRNPSPAMPV